MDLNRNRKKIQYFRFFFCVNIYLVLLRYNYSVVCEQHFIIIRDTRKYNGDFIYQKDLLEPF